MSLKNPRALSGLGVWQGLSSEGPRALLCIYSALHTHPGSLFSAGLICSPALGRINYCPSLLGRQTEDKAVRDSGLTQGTEVWLYFQATEHKPSLFRSWST